MIGVVIYSFYHSEDLKNFVKQFVESYGYIAVFIVSYIFAEQIYNFLVEPYADAVKDDQHSRRLIFTALHETFITYLKVAFF